MGQSPQDAAADIAKRLKQARHILAGALTGAGLAEGGRGRTGAGHPRIREYLEARGIRMEWLPGGVVPPPLYFHPSCEDVWDPENRTYHRCPAMVAVCETPLERITPPPFGEGLVSMVHRTFLDPDGRAAKRSERVGGDDEDDPAARRHKGVRNVEPHTGHAIRLTPYVNERGWAGGIGPGGAPFPGGVLELGEGIETMTAALALTGWASWSCLDTYGLESVVLPEEIFEPFDETGAVKPDGWWVHTIVIAGDLDASKSGQATAHAAKDRLGERHRRATVVVRLPRVEGSHGLVEVATAGDRRMCPRCRGGCKINGKACPKCKGEGEVGFYPGEERPRLVNGEAMKSIDWLEVLAHEPLGRDGGRAMLMRGLGEDVLATNRVRALGWRPSPTPAPVPPSPTSAAGQRGEAANAYQGGRTHSPSSTPGEGGAGADRKGPYSFGVGPPHYGGLALYEPQDERPMLHAGNLRRAQLFLLMECAPPREVGSRCFRLVRWGGEWFWFEAGGHAWRRLDECELYGRIEEWLSGFWSVKKRGEDGIAILERVETHEKMVSGVMKSLAHLVLVDVDRLPAWLPPSIDEHGMPPWDLPGIATPNGTLGVRRARERAAWHGGGWKVHPTLGDASDYIVFANGMLDREALISDRRVELRPITPDLLTTAARPYDLPVMDLERCLDGGMTEEMWWRLCPNWYKALLGATRSDTAELRAGRIRQLQLMFGDTIGPDRTIEKVFLFVGPKRSIKGCTREALSVVCGKETIAMTSFMELGGDRFGLAPLVGKSVAIMSDAHVGQMGDSTMAVERIKAIRGNDPVSVRDLYQKARPNVYLGCRFWIFCNDEPDKLRDNSGALAGSLVVWSMTETFYGQEDASIKAGIPDEGPGIAVWALAGHADLFGMKRPVIGMNELDAEIFAEMEETSSPMTQFIRECLNLGNDEESEIKQAYECYVRWCKHNGYSPVGKNKLIMRLRPIVSATVSGVKLTRVQPQLDDGSRPRVVRGFGLRRDMANEYAPWVPDVGAGKTVHVTADAVERGVGQPPLPM